MQDMRHQSHLKKAWISNFDWRVCPSVEWLVGFITYVIVDSIVSYHTRIPPRHCASSSACSCSYHSHSSVAHAFLFRLIRQRLVRKEHSVRKLGWREKRNANNVTQAFTAKGKETANRWLLIWCWCCFCYCRRGDGTENGGNCLYWFISVVKGAFKDSE